MEHIRQYDWCSSQPDIYFINEAELDNCVTERILRNAFRDPQDSSDPEDCGKPTFNWDEIFKEKDDVDRFHRIFVPGLRKYPPYTKLSCISVPKQYQCLKILSVENPHVLPKEFLPRPTNQDRKTMVDIKEVYAEEQKEYIQWAKTLWTTSQCVRALRPKPEVENVYEAEFKVKSNKMQSFPKHYEMAAQIPLETAKHNCHMVHKKDLLKVDITELPQINCEQVTKKTTIFGSCDIPEPCNKHPCRFILPNETSMTILPQTEVDRELAQFALDNGTQFIASENALKCLMELDKHWTIPLTVAQVIGADGDKTNVKVLGSEFSIHRESAQTRTYKAFRHLLEFTLIPPSEKLKLTNRTKTVTSMDPHDSMEQLNETMDSMEVMSDDDDDHLFIVTESDSESQDTRKKTRRNTSDKMEIDAIPSKTKKQNGKGNDKTKKTDDFYRCTCKDLAFQSPPPRSYRKWKIVNNSVKSNYEIIVHCPHKVRGESGEVIVEPIPEYQLDLGGCTQSDSKVKSLALSLLLRKNASLLNARIDTATGELVLLENIFPAKFNAAYGNLTPDIANTIYTALDQIQGLLPGNYILQHEPSHGANVLLYATVIRDKAQKLDLEFDCSQLAEQDEAKSVRTPTLAPVLLPWHKFRKQLPCTFALTKTQLVKDAKKAAPRQKTPPQAIKWPKRKRNKQTKKNR